MGIDINQFLQLNDQWTDISQKLEECRERLLFLGEGLYRTENANWVVAVDGSIIASPIADRMVQTDLFDDDEK